MATKNAALVEVQPEPQAEEEEYYSYLRPLEVVQADLKTRLSDNLLKEVHKGAGQDFKYVPWETTANELDRVFGPFGWNESINDTHFDTQRGIYAITRSLDGYARTRSGDIVRIHREATGRAVATGDDARAHDTAIAAADTDSFSRVAKKLGDAFGRFLYEKTDPANQAEAPARRPAVQGTVTQGAVATKGKYPPTAGQLGFLRKLGYSDTAIGEMDFKTWKNILDNRIEAPVTNPMAPVEDDIPF